MQRQQANAQITQKPGYCFVQNTWSFKFTLLLFVASCRFFILVKRTHFWTTLNMFDFEFIIKWTALWSLEALPVFQVSLGDCLLSLSSLQSVWRFSRLSCLRSSTFASGATSCHIDLVFLFFFCCSLFLLPSTWAAPRLCLLRWPFSPSAFVCTRMWEMSDIVSWELNVFERYSATAESTVAWKNKQAMTPSTKEEPQAIT